MTIQLKNELFIKKAMKNGKLINFPIILKENESSISMALQFTHKDLGEIVLSTIRENKVRVFKCKNAIEQTVNKLSFIPLTVENMKVKNTSIFTN